MVNLGTYNWPAYTAVFQTAAVVVWLAVVNGAAVNERTAALYTNPKLADRVSKMLKGHLDKDAKYNGAALDACCVTCNATAMAKCIDHSVGNGSSFDPFDAPRSGLPMPAKWPWIGGAEPGPGDREKIYLFLLSDGHAGSSSLAGLLSTSAQVTNLCTAKVWQCEGEKVLMHFTEDGKQAGGRGDHKEIPPFLHRDDRNAMKRGDETWIDPENVTRHLKPVDWTGALKIFHKYWDGSKTVMLDKSPAFLTQAPRIAKQLREKGLRSAFIVMSHSACTMSTSPHGLELRGNTNPTHLYQLPNANLANWNRTNAQLINTIMKLLEKGENVMHVRYEAMLADPPRFSRELETFLPQLAKLDPESSGIGDAWKYGGKRQRNTGAKDRSVSVAQYAREHPLHNSCSEYPAEWTSEMRLLGYV